MRLILNITINEQLQENIPSDQNLELCNNFHAEKQKLKIMELRAESDILHQDQEHLRRNTPKNSKQITIWKNSSK